MALGALGAVCGALALLSSPVASSATTPVGLQTPVMVMARKQPVGQFLNELLGEVGVPVWVDDAVRGPVNGDFDKPLQDVLEDVRRAFRLVYYYDGAVLHVYPSSTIDRKIMSLSGSLAREVIDNVDTLQLPDESNRLEATSMGLAITGTRRFLEQVQEIADAVENKAANADSPETFRVFNLQYGWADDVSLQLGGETIVVPGVVSVLRDLVGPDGVGAGADEVEMLSDVQRTPISPAQPKLKGQGLQSIGANESLDNGEEEAGDSVVKSVTTGTGKGSGRVRIVADPLHNAVVVRDRADRMETYEQLIASLDVEPLMVEIEATIIDMNTERLRDLGIDWRVEYGVRNNPVDSSGTGGVDDGGIVSMVLGDRPRFISNVRALERQGAARIVSKPHVITLANVEALLDSTSTFYVRVAGREEVDLFDVSVGTTMRVTPHVLDGSGGSRIKLLANIEDGTATDERVDRIPVIDRSTINTQALVDEGQSLLIGGLIRESDSNSISKVPVLGDIPGLGALFRGNKKSTQRTERLFLITPRLTTSASGDEFRLDAPILQGSEAGIIRSAPIRLQEANAALAERDATPPAVPPLPRSTREGNLAKDASIVKPLSRSESAPVKLIEEPQPRRRTGPEGERMPLGSPDDKWQIKTSTGRFDALRPAGEGWQEVPGSRPQER